MDGHQKALVIVFALFVALGCVDMITSAIKDDCSDCQKCQVEQVNHD